MATAAAANRKIWYLLASPYETFRGYRGPSADRPVLYIMDPGEVGEVLQGLQIHLSWTRGAKAGSPVSRPDLQAAETITQLADVIGTWAAGDMI